MSELKPCPFCGNLMDSFPNFVISFKRDGRKRFGIYHEICILKCNHCSCTIQQAGATKEEAKMHAFNLWNSRIEAPE